MRIAPTLWRCVIFLSNCAAQISWRVCIWQVPEGALWLLVFSVKHIILFWLTIMLVPVRIRKSFTWKMQCISRLVVREIALAQSLSTLTSTSGYINVPGHSPMAKCSADDSIIARCHANNSILLSTCHGRFDGNMDTSAWRWCWCLQGQLINLWTTIEGSRLFVDGCNLFLKEIPWFFMTGNPLI